MMCLKKIICFTLFFICLNVKSNGGSLFEIPIVERIKNSNCIAIVTLQNKNFFLLNNTVYTTYTFSINEAIFGCVRNDTITMSCIGGKLNYNATLTFPNYEVNENRKYLILGKLNSKQSIETTAGIQGLLEIDEWGNVSDYFKNLDFSTEILPILVEQNKIKNRINFEGNKKNRSLQMQITSISPNEIIAGMNNVLTINGNNFGSTKGNGKVLFKNANNGGSSYIEPQNSDYLSWSDTKITLKVPFDAGTGSVKLMKDNATALSPNLTVNWARVNYIESNISYSPILSDRSETGGYLISIEGKIKEDSTFTNRINEAIINWRCATEMNFALSNEMAASSTKNTISFAKNGELAQGVLGICYSNYSSCNGNDWYTTGFEIKILDTTIWNSKITAPSTSEYDFLSVITHELGHAQQLAHVISSSDLMNYSIGKGQVRRVLSSENVSGVKTIIENSIDGINCTEKPLKKIITNECTNVYFTYYSIEKSRLFPNPSKDKIIAEIFLDTPTNIEWTIYNEIGELIEINPSQKIDAGVKEYIINVNDGKYLPGMYFMIIKAGESILKKKFIVSN